MTRYQEYLKKTRTYRNGKYSKEIKNLLDGSTKCISLSEN